MESNNNVDQAEVALGTELRIGGESLPRGWKCPTSTAVKQGRLPIQGEPFDNVVAQTSRLFRKTDRKLQLDDA